MRWLVFLILLGRVAGAEPAWRVDAAARGVASVEIDDGAQRRSGLVPALDLRVQRAFGHVLVGGSLGAGFPAFYGRHELAASLDLERVVREPVCELVPDPDASVPMRVCHGWRWAASAGVDAGVGLYYFDAPPETSSSSNALLYWGPEARGRLQVHALSVLANGRSLGIVVGVSLALMSAHYTTTATGTGIRLEPAAEIGLSMRL